jgi:RHS repeat-associated protein
MSSVALGNGITEQLAWNDRLQLTQLAVGPGGSALTLGLYPCTGLQTSCTTGNTGSIQSETITAPNLNVTQTYGYDALNRLTSAGEGSGSWSQSYEYDTFGNRWVSAYWNFSLSPFTPTALSNFNANNQVQVDSSAYDSAGDQTQIGAQVSTFDAEGRMVSTLSGTTTYVYDGEGQRVMKQVSGGATIVYVYDAGGNLAAEYSTAATQSACGTATCYVSVDHLGSTRLVTDSAGNVTQRYDYLPFGEEIPAGLGGRTTTMGYEANPAGAPDGFNPKFTGQVRDVESGLDYFNARYYSPEQGRFVSADPGNAGSDPSDPQTWNGYAYVSGNPLAYTDPSGEGFWGDLGLFLGPIIGSFIPGANLALDAIAGFAIGETVDVVRGGLSALSLIPGMGTNQDLVGTLGGCGGPLGTCGTLGSDPWSELSGLGDVQDPGRFIFDAQQQSSRSAYSTLFPLEVDATQLLNNVPAPTGGAQITAVAKKRPAPEPRAPRARISFASCMAGALINNFIGNDTQTFVTGLVHVGAVLVAQGAGAALPGPGWVYTGTAVLWDVSMAGKSYIQCKTTGGFGDLSGD